jgi:hypothetical protein
LLELAVEHSSRVLARHQRGGVEAGTQPAVRDTRWAAALDTNEHLGDLDSAQPPARRVLLQKR